MKSALVTNPIVASNRLNELGWTMEEMREIVYSSVGARRSCTENHPPAAPGFNAWSEALATLRKLGSLKGFERNDDGHLCSTFDKKNKIRFGVCNTGEGTGLEHGIARNNNERGAATIQIVASNQSSFDFMDSGQNVIQMPYTKGGVSYWYLCIYCAGEEVRAELSCPAMCEKGFFTDFFERIKIELDVEGNNPSGRRIETPNNGSDFEINVTRKQA